MSPLSQASFSGQNIALASLSKARNPCLSVGGRPAFWIWNAVHWGELSALHAYAARGDGPAGGALANSRHFRTNLGGDPKMPTVGNDTVVWGAHMQEARDS